MIVTLIGDAGHAGSPGGAGPKGQPGKGAEVWGGDGHQMQH